VSVWPSLAVGDRQEEDGSVQIASTAAVVGQRTISGAQRVVRHHEDLSLR
jgi:hypothetical protein